MRPWFVRAATRLGAAALLLGAGVPSLGAQSPQSVTREACTGGDLVACVRVEVTANDTELLFTVRHLGIFGNLELASQPSIISSLVFTTEQSYSDDVVELEASVSPMGNASLNDYTPWTFLDVGDQWGLFPKQEESFIRGIGSSVAASNDVTDGEGNFWRQIGTTGPDGALLFTVLLPTPLAFSLEDLSIFGLEAIAFDGTPRGVNGSCGSDRACGAVPTAAVPEPSSAALTLIVLAFLGHRARRRATGTREGA